MKQIAMVLLYVMVADGFTCPPIEDCSCLVLHDSTEIECQEELQIHVKPRASAVTVQCTFNQSRFDIDKFPKIEVGNVNDLIFNYCPLPRDGFREIMDRFKIGETKNLVFDSLDDIEHVVIKKKLLEHLNHLQQLRLANNKLEYIDKDVFEDLQSLVKIDLNNNKLKLHPDTFRYTPNVIHLELSQNEITELDPHIFYPLKHLKVLHLFANKLSYMDKALFEKCTNLRSLELSFNPLSNLSAQIFSSLTNLSTVALRGSKLEKLPAKLFSSNKLLKKILFSRSEKLRYLPDALFSNLSKLEELCLDQCNLSSIPNNLLNGCVSLTYINLSKNKVTSLPEDVFYGLTKMKTLLLANNQLTALSNKLFINLDNLITLDLSINKLETIDDQLLKNLVNLEELNLKQNRIKFIHGNAFRNNENLKILLLTHNMLSFATTAPFNPLINLEILDLSHNFIQEIEADWVTYKTHLKELNLTWNNITEITVYDLQFLSSNRVNLYLQHNNISLVDLSDFHLLPNDSVGDYNIYLSENPIICDCRLFDMVKYLQLTADPKVPKMVTMKDNMKCKDAIFYNTSVSELKLEELTCSEEVCPDNCVCKWRRYDHTYVVDCSNRNLTSIPYLKTPKSWKYKKTEVNLTGNQLVMFPSREFGFENVTSLFLTDNYISNITWIPAFIEIMYLDGNRLESLSNSMLEVLNKSTTLAELNLERNPWTCDCSTVNFTNYLREHLVDSTTQVDASNIKCVDGRQLVVLNESDLCLTATIYLIVFSSLFFMLMLIFIITYVCYLERIKVWLFTNDLLLCWVTEEEIDRDKPFDAFISYSHKDEQFVVKEILPQLEGGIDPYKLCLHYRNWLVGEFIPTQIVQSVEDSRRTIVILSKHFLESEWGKMEFRTAHKNALTEKRVRVIVVIYGDVDPDEIIDQEMKAYLKTNTYIKWGDPAFWNKLRYALPHSQKKLRGKQRKFNNVIKKIDKLDLMSIPTTPNVGSTPPVAINIDPLLLKSNPLDFTPRNNMTPIIKYNGHVTC